VVFVAEPAAPFVPAPPVLGTPVLGVVLVAGVTGDFGLITDVGVPAVPVLVVPVVPVLVQMEVYQHWCQFL
jgi:hypothetical protein